MNPNIVGVIGPVFLNQVPTLSRTLMTLVTTGLVGTVGPLNPVRQSLWGTSWHRLLCCENMSMCVRSWVVLPWDVTKRCRCLERLELRL